MTTDQQKLYDAIDEILWNYWDPIGVNDTEEARTEYKSYTPSVFILKIKGADRKAIAEKLYEIEIDMMGFPEI
jgi:hypothetical protein